MGAVGRWNIRFLANRLHLWAGLICGVPAAAIAVTGAVVALRHQRPTPVLEQMFVAPPSIDALLASAIAALPPETKPQQYQPATRSFPAVVQYGVARTETNPRGISRILIDPVDLRVVPDQTPPSSRLIVLVRNFHVNVLAGDVGRTIVGAIGAVMAFLALSGMIQWWPRSGRWREALFTSGRGSVLRTLREIHGTIGAWFLIVFLFVAASGFILAFPAAPPTPTPVNDAPSASSSGPPSADMAVTRAIAAVPGTILRQVDLPRAPGDGFRVGLSRPGADVLAPMIFVTVDGSASRVQSIMDPDQLPLAQYLRLWIRPMHEGAGVGWVWWVPVLASSVLPALFIISGIVIWALKGRARTS